MNRPRLLGATAAATLPAALSAAVLVSAPFAGTTTAPLADTHQVAGAKAHPSGARTSNGGAGLSFDVPGTGVAALAGCELGLLAVGAGVLVTVVRRRSA